MTIKCYTNGETMTPDRMLMVRLSDELHKAVRVKAAEIGKPMSEVVRELLAAWVEDRVSLTVEETRGKRKSQ